MSRTSLATAMIIGICWELCGCQVNRNNSLDTSSTPAAAEGDPLTFKPPLAPPPPPFDQGIKAFSLFRGTGTQTAKIGYLAPSHCQELGLRPPEVRIRTYLRTSVGWHTLDLTLEGSDTLSLGDPVRPDLVHVEVEGHQFSFTSTSSMAANLRTRACVLANTESEDRQLGIDQLFVENMRQWMKAISPDCTRVDLLTTGFECTLGSIEPGRAAEILAQTQKQMVQKWSRQPYLFARRVALGINLAQALANNNSDQDLNTFCKILTTAAPGELPITLSSRRWQRGVCNNESKNRRQLGLFGLGRTVEELNFLTKLFDSTSRLGQLVIKIPDADLPEKQILLNLAPEIDVADSIANEASRLINEAQNIPDRENRQICWHPVYGESVAMLRTALGLGLVNGEGRALCKTSTILYSDQGPSLSSADRYIAESITSETEFIVANGQTRTLRLPAGRYSYSLRALPADHEGWDDASQQVATAGGLIVWDQRKPRAVISKW